MSAFISFKNISLLIYEYTFECMENYQLFSRYNNISKQYRIRMLLILIKLSFFNENKFLILIG